MKLLKKKQKKWLLYRSTNGKIFIIYFGKIEYTTIASIPHYNTTVFFVYKYQQCTKIKKTKRKKRPTYHITTLFSGTQKFQQLHSQKTSQQQQSHHHRSQTHACKEKNKIHKLFINMSKITELIFEKITVISNWLYFKLFIVKQTQSFKIERYSLLTIKSKCG